MITNNGNDWHYLAIKNISELSRGITSNHNRDFYCINCFHLYRTKKKLKKHERICKDHDFYYVKMPDGKKILKYNPGEKSLKAPHFVCADLVCLLKNIGTCQNNPEKKVSIRFQVIHQLHVVHMINRKMKENIIGEKIAWISFAMI